LEESNMSTFTIDTAGVTDIGNVREANEDHFLTGGDLFAVADGMGGEGNGEIASRVAIEALQEAFADEPTAAGLVEAVRRANAAVLARSEAEPEPTRMGTTIAAVARVGSADDDRLVVVNVGDSRVYLFREGRLTRLSSDHSRVADLVRAGEITEEEAVGHPERHMLTHAIGIDGSVTPHVNHTRPRPGDRLLLCSDGLFNEVPVVEIGAALAETEQPDEAAVQLVALANQHGGSDNVTAVVLDVS
jgi:protein phosphatase